MNCNGKKNIENVLCIILMFFVLNFLQDFCHQSRPFPAVNESRSWPGNPPSPFVQLSNSTALIWAPNISAPACWPPLSALRLFLSPEASSCVETCQDAGFICEAAFFPFINNMEAFSGWDAQLSIDAVYVWINEFALWCVLFNWDAIVTVNIKL